VYWVRIFDPVYGKGINKIIPKIDVNVTARRALFCS
jgi:hypothetical protein